MYPTLILFFNSFTTVCEAIWRGPIQKQRLRPPNNDLIRICSARGNLKTRPVLNGFQNWDNKHDS